MSCHASDSPLVAIVSDSKPSKSIAVGIFFDKYKAPYEVGIEPTNADFYTGSVITVVSKANPEDPTVVLHGQGTALLTLDIFGGDLSSAAITNLAIQLLLLVPFKTIGRSPTSQAAHCSRKWISHGQLPPLSGICIIRVGLEPTTLRFLVSYSTS